mmetsp:Transcript_34168/g.89845  ORF Transcript_34168/g.89845 Transcript_34168/m.89845 type:complete len:341 (+) Transcript_34168:415-1437(+)
MAPALSDRKRPDCTPTGATRTRCLRPHPRTRSLAGPPAHQLARVLDVRICGRPRNAFIWIGLHCVVICCEVGRRLVHLHVRSGRPLPHMFEDLRREFGEVLRLVEVLHGRRRDVQLVFRPVVLVVIVERQLVRHLLAEDHGRLVRPAARDVPDRVTAAAEDECGNLLREHEADAVGVAVDGQIEAAQPVARQRVRATLQYDRARLVPLHDLADNRLEDRLVGGIVHAVLQRVVDGVVLARRSTHVLDVARAWEVLAKLVERDREHAVRRIEGLLDAVAVVDVDVDVQHAHVDLEELEDGEHDVVHVAEAARLAGLGMVHAPRPVQHNVRSPVVDPRRARE